jgi:hypothetical protein
MPKEQMHKKFLYFLVFVSFFSFFLIILIAFFPPQIQESFQWRKQATGLIFILTCASGMISVFFPENCSKIFHEDRKTISSTVSVGEKEGFQRSSEVFGVVLTHGHHPECQGFYHHEFRVGKKTWCVACMGLFVGAVLAIFGGISYLFFEFSDRMDALFLVAFGITGVALCLLHYTFFDVHSGSIRFSLNAFFIFGMFLILAGIDCIIKCLSLNFFLNFLFVFWLFTRILLSKSKHKEICQTCNIDCNLKNRELRSAGKSVSYTGNY